MSVRMMMQGRKPAGGGGSFDPSTVTGLRAWYDADDAGSFTFSSGSIVSQWNDLSSNGNHLVQATTASQPSRTGTVNGRSSVVFDGSNDTMAAVLASGAVRPYTVFMVAVNAETGSTQRTAFTFEPNDGRFYRASAGNLNMFQGAVLSSGVSWGTGVRLVTGVFNGVSSTVAVDSGSDVSGSAGTGNNGTEVNIGSLYGTGEYWNGQVCEFLYYNGILGSTDQADIKAYLKAKWGTA